MKSLLLFLPFMIFGPLLRAQEIDANIDVKFDRLSPSQKDYIQDFKTKLETYINERRWTDVDFHGDKIPVTMQIDFLSGSDGGEFSAQVVLVSQRRIYQDGRPTQNTAVLLRILDPKWTFTYFKGQPLYYDEFQFDDLRSFIDFYMYIVLGTDFDSYELMQGTQYYQKATQIGQRSQSSNRSSEWQGQSNQFSRMNLLAELQNAQYDGFRKALYWYFYEGLDFMTTEKDDAQKAVARAFENIADVLMRTNAKSLLLTMWLETKSPELCTLLEGYNGRKQLMTTMIQADPARAETYRKCNF